MSQIQMEANAGYAFTVELQDPYANFVPLATGLPLSEPKPGIYVGSTGSLTSIVRVVAVAGQLRVVGYANLGHTGDNGNSEVFDSLHEAENAGADFGTIAAAILQLNNKIKTGTVTVVSPVNADGSINPIVIGDDYLAINNRSIELFIDPVPGVTLGPSTTCLFGGESKDRGAWLVSGTASEATVDQLPKWKLSFELLSTHTTACRPGAYEWSATLLSNGQRVTKVQGEVCLVTSQTQGTP